MMTDSTAEFECEATDCIGCKALRAEKEQLEARNHFLRAEKERLEAEKEQLEARNHFPMP